MPAPGTSGAATAGAATTGAAGAVGTTALVTGFATITLGYGLIAVAAVGVAGLVRNATKRTKDHIAGIIEWHEWQKKFNAADEKLSQDDSGAASGETKVTRCCSFS